VSNSFNKLESVADSAKRGIKKREKEKKKGERTSGVDGRHLLLLLHSLLSLFGQFRSHLSEIEHIGC
jgi:hypothetical protein